MSVASFAGGRSDGSAERAAIQALRTAQEAAAQVPAYAQVLRLAGYPASRLRGVADFRQLPVLDKASYLKRYSVQQRCRRADLPRAYMVTSTSGSTGESTLWPRFPEQEAPLHAALGGMFEEHFRIRERHTLVVVASAMGPWGFGMSVAQMGQRLFAQPGRRGTVVTPGYNVSEALGFVEQLSPHYDQTILVSYPAALAQLLAEGERRGVPWASLNIGGMTSGEAVSEAQRERILQYAGKDPERLEGFVAMFGITEIAGILGYDTLLCLLVRRLCVRTPALAETLFGTAVMPSFIQYNALRNFVETVNGELMLTTRSAAPLVRYNTHDRGGLLPFEVVIATCRAHGYDLAAELRARGFGPEYLRPLPFLYCFGRSDGVIVHGANVYRDHVAHVLDGPLFTALGTGRFELAVATAPDGQATLTVTLELRAGVTPTAEQQLAGATALLEELQQINAEFRSSYRAARGGIRLDLKLMPFGTLEQRGIKRVQLTKPAAQQASPDAVSTEDRGEA